MSLPGSPDAGTARLRLAVVAGAVLLVLGVWGTFGRETPTIGWTSSAPLVSGAPRTVVLDTPGMLSLAALLAGVAVLAAAAGYVVARRE